MNPAITIYNHSGNEEENKIFNFLANTINANLKNADNKIWHKHPVWFLDGNPIVGYSKLKSGIRLMFWSGASFEEDCLQIGTGKFKDATITYINSDQIIIEDVIRCIEKSKIIQWDYKNLVKRKGKLEPLF